MSEANPPSGDEIVAWSENGRLLVAGEPRAVDRYLQAIQPEEALDVRGLRNIADGLAVLAGATGVAHTSGRYVQLTKDSWEKLQTQRLVPAEKGAFRMFVRGDAGRITGQLKWKPASLAGTQALSVQTAAASAALRLAVKEVQGQVEEVARDVDDLKRIIEAADVGNIAGLYRILANARDQVDKHGHLSQATWDAIAPHEVTAQQAADRVRSLLRSTLNDLPLSGDASARTQAAERLVDEGTLRTSLRLLLLAEQCRLLWRSLKLDHVRRTEEDALPSEIAAAEHLLKENAAADLALIALLEGTITRLGTLHALDGLRVVSRRRLPALAGDLRAELDQFAQLRRAQLDAWVVSSGPTVKDAAKEIGHRAARAAIEARKMTGRTFERFGQRLQGEAVPRKDDSRDSEPDQGPQ